MNELLTAANDELPKESASCYHIDSSFESADSNSWLTDYSELHYNENDDFWEPPLSMEGLSILAHSNAYHGSLLIARSNYVCARLIKGALKKNLFQQFGRDYIQFGQAALLKLRDHFGRCIGLFPLPAMYLRKRKNGDFWLLGREGTKRLYKQNDVIFLAQYDPKQQVYGIPDYIGGLQSTLLNKDSTSFRRRYYKNGAHLGFILYSRDSKLKPEDEEMLKTAIASAKGVGNFKSMFINIPGGCEKGVEIIPIGNIATKDEFNSIQTVTSQAILVSHRFPPGKGGIIPTNTGGFGDPEKVGREYLKDETLPICEIIQDEINSDHEIARRKDLQIKFNMVIG